MSITDDTEIWLDRFPRRLGCGWLAARLPGDLPPSYVYALLTVGVLSIVHANWRDAIGTPVAFV